LYGRSDNGPRRAPGGGPRDRRAHRAVRPGERPNGGAALDELRRRLGARRGVPPFGHVDPAVHHPVPRSAPYRCVLSYLGTYSADRQNALSALMVEPARRRPLQRFLIGGAQYPQDFPWHPNIFFVRHLPPIEHPAFFSSSRLTLNVTREPMAKMGWCP